MIEFITAHKEDLALAITSLIAFASALANFFPKATTLKKIVHWLALNFKVDKVK